MGKYTLGDIGDTYNGLTGKSAVDFGSGSPFITYKSIFDNSKIDVSKIEYVRITDAERAKRTQNEVKYGGIFLQHHQKHLMKWAWHLYYLQTLVIAI